MIAYLGKGHFKAKEFGTDMLVNSVCMINDNYWLTFNTLLPSHCVSVGVCFCL